MVVNGKKIKEIFFIRDLVTTGNYFDILVKDLILIRDYVKIGDFFEIMIDSFKSPKEIKIYSYKDKDRCYTDNFKTSERSRFKSVFKGQLKENTDFKIYTGNENTLRIEEIKITNLTK